MPSAIGVDQGAQSRRISLQRRPSNECVCGGKAKPEVAEVKTEAKPKVKTALVDTFERRMTDTEEAFPSVLMPPPKDERMGLIERAHRAVRHALGVLGRILRHMAPKIQFGIGVNLWQLWPR